MDRWSFIVIPKKDLKGKWWMKKSLPELQKGTFMGTLLVAICATLVTCTICYNGAKILILCQPEIEMFTILVPFNRELCSN